MILPSAGTGERAGTDKLWVDVAGQPLFAYAFHTALESGVFDRIVVVAPRQRWDAVRALPGSTDVDLRLVQGGARRQDSVTAGLTECKGSTYVAVHDAARPLCSVALMQAVVAAADGYGAATAALPVIDTVKRVEDGTVVETLERDGLFNTQTPQAFSTDLLTQAHGWAELGQVSADDDATLVERMGFHVRVVPGESRNFKVTRPEDLTLLEALLAQQGRHPRE